MGRVVSDQTKGGKIDLCRCFAWRRYSAIWNLNIRSEWKEKKGESSPGEKKICLLILQRAAQENLSENEGQEPKKRKEKQTYP